MTEDIKKFDFIDALRGYAILLVILVHASESVAPGQPALLACMQWGARGVQLFYVASALTLCLSWMFRSKHEKAPLRNFFIRRFFRIAPLFYAAIIFYVILYGLAPRVWAPNGLEWWYVPLTALFLNGFHPETITSVVPGGWSIAVEMNFYLVLPFLLRRITSLKASLVFFVVTLAVYQLSRLLIRRAFAGVYPDHQLYLVSSFEFLNFSAQLPVFAIGIIAFFVFGRKESLRRQVAGGSLLFVLGLAALVALDPSLAARAARNPVFAGGAFALLALVLAAYPVKALVNPVITQVGKISFGMYLTHFAILYYFKKTGFSGLFASGDLSSLAHFLCVVAVTALVSYVLYRTVERRGILLGKRIIDRLETGGGSKTPASA